MPTPRSIICAAPLLALLALSIACEPEDFVEVENQAPVARASGPSTAMIGEVVMFTGSLSSDADGQIVSFSWSFGDGNSGSGEGPSNIYSAAGDYQVTLTVTDEQGATGETQLAIQIISNQPPVAVIDAPATAIVDQVIHLSAAGSSDPDGQVVAYSWLISDGATADTVELDHSFTSAGSFSVTLTVTDDVGVTGEATHSVVVEAGQADYSGTWSWTLVDSSQRDLGLICGTFQDSTLIIASTPPTISITEQAGSTSMEYTGTIDDDSFHVSNTQLTITQSITGTFTSATTFDGVYAIDPGITTCDDRAVLGVKAP